MKRLVLPVFFPYGKASHALHPVNNRVYKKWFSLLLINSSLIWVSTYLYRPIKITINPTRTSKPLPLLWLRLNDFSMAAWTALKIPKATHLKAVPIAITGPTFFSASSRLFFCSNSLKLERSCSLKLERSCSLKLERSWKGLVFNFGKASRLVVSFRALFERL